MLFLKFQNKRDLIKYRSMDAMISPVILIKYSFLPNLVQNNLESSDSADFYRPVHHLFELKSRTTVIRMPTCDEGLFLTSEVDWHYTSSLIS